MSSSQKVTQNKKENAFQSRLRSLGNYKIFRSYKLSVKTIFCPLFFDLRVLWAGYTKIGSKYIEGTNFNCKREILYMKPQTMVSELLQHLYICTGYV
jgi:hypothetical protein